MRKEARAEITREMEERVDKEVERRMHDNFLDWEDSYKAKKIQ